MDGLPVDALRVVSFRGREAMSRAYSFRLTVTANATDSEDLERAALGQAATFVWQLEKTVRAFYGVVASIRVSGRRDFGRVEYRMHFVPRLWLLKRKRRTRIFQKMRVVDVVTAVLLEAGIATRWQLSKVYPVRDYCTQYEETDYEFVTRLLAEAGIYFYFPEGGPVADALSLVSTIVGAAGSAASSVVAAVAGSAVGSVVGSVAAEASPLLPGDTVICGDDAMFYPPLGPDDAAALAASSALALAGEAAQAVGGALGGASPLAGALVGGAAAAAGGLVGALTSSAAPVLQYLETLEASISHTDKVTRFDLGTSVRATAAEFRDYDPERPLTKLSSRALSAAPFPESGLQAVADAATAAGSALGEAAPGPLGSAGAAVADYAGKAAAAIGAVAGDSPPPYLEIYDHHGPFLFPKWTLPSDEAPRMLRQARRRASIGRGRSGCLELEPGHKFALAGHPVPRLDGAYVVTSVEHRGRAHPDPTDRERFTVYENAFECAPVSMTFVPPKPKRRSVQVSLTAVVVGPAGSEIHVDAMGQIKVQFHWDREGKSDDRSSCWIRTMHPWGGAGWGVQFIPRVGMEVVVVFEGGDPDKPMVIGALYNATHPSPFPLPQDKTRSGWRTQSTPNAEGFNELSFEDRAGEEQIYLHAQANLDEVVGRDHNTKVARDQSEVVSRDQSSRVLGSRSLETLGSMVTKTLGSSEEHVGGLRTEKAGGGRRVVVQGDDTTRTTGRSVHSVGQTHSMKVGTNFGLEVGSTDTPGTMDLYAFGNALIGSGLTFSVRADQRIVLICGESTLELSKDTIRLAAPKLQLDASKELLAGGDGPKLRLDKKAEMTADSVRLYSSKASLELDESAHIDGELVKIACGPDDPSSASSKATKAATQRLEIRLTDQDFEPYKNKDFVVKGGGVRVEGKTDGDGHIGVDLPAEATIADITLWLEKRPTGETRRYAIELKPMDPPDTPTGQQVRLRHLGYYHRSPSGVVDEPTKHAIEAFQSDHELEATGTADGATIAKIVEVHGS